MKTNLKKYIIILGLLGLVIGAKTWYEISQSIVISKNVPVMEIYKILGG